jgi:hypothetical protein
VPRPLKRHSQQSVQLTHVPERERPQKRPKRRGRRQPAPEQPPGAPGPEHVGVVDAVGAQHHRNDKRYHLAPRAGRPGPIAAQSHQIPRQRLDPQPLGQRRDQRDPACETTRSSSNSTRSPSSPTATSSCTKKVTS